MIGIISNDIMYTSNNSSDFFLTCVKDSNTIEFKTSRNGNQIEGILSKSISYNWIAFPSLHVCCQLADLDDVFWNSEQLKDLFDNTFDVDTILMAISELKDLFEQDHQTYFNGQNFLSKNEYIFWLENECEILSSQLMEAQEVLGADFNHKLQKEKKDFHNMMRFQYDDAIFE